MTSAGSHTPIVCDDQLRSEYVWGLIQETPSLAVADSETRIPKTIVQYWDDSLVIPEDVRLCIESWSPLEQEGFSREMFDDDTAERFIESEYGPNEVRAFGRCPHPAMRCDYFRLCYILNRGGFYVDADEVYQGGDILRWFRDDWLKIQPLCYDIPSGAMIPVGACRASEKYSRERVYYVNNNPLIAPRGHPIIRLALERSTRVLLSSSRHRLDIQSTTGPGNLTMSLVTYCMSRDRGGGKGAFSLITDWDEVSLPRWPLSYRSDERNWRLWRPQDDDLPSLARKRARPASGNEV